MARPNESSSADPAPDHASPPDLPSLVHRTTDRRTFLTRASLGLALPTLGAALGACTSREQHEARAPQHAGVSDTGVVHPHVNNDDAAPAGTRAGLPQVVPTLKASAPYRTFDPRLPPRRRGTVRLHFTTRDVNVYASPDVVVPAWTFEGTTPGPIVHIGMGDTVEFTLTNGSTAMPHSMDFHAAQIDPRTAFRSISPGETLTYRFTPKYPGAFLYHCGTQPVLLHIGSGMYGAIIVDPPTPLPPAREFVLVQGEYYIGKDEHGLPTLDYDKMLGELPDFVTFNGIAGQYQTDPIRVKRGDRVRFYVLDAGPTHPCAFHIVGEQFDTVYIGAPPQNALHGVQTYLIGPGGGMIFELTCDVPGEFPFVNHAFGHGQKGAIGLLIVE